MWFAKLTFGQLVDQAAERWGEREALCFEGQRWSFAELREEIDRAAKALIAAGVQPGDHVCLWLVNRPGVPLYLFRGRQDRGRLGADQYRDSGLGTWPTS